MNKTISYFTFDYDSYYEELKNQLQNPQTDVFIDTNVLFTLAFVSEELRKIILDWFHENEKRVHVPHWVYEEYIKHTRSKTEMLKVSPVPKFDFSNIEHDFENVHDYLDDNKIKGYSFSDEAEFLSKLEKAIKTIKTAKKILADNCCSHDVSNFLFEKNVLDFKLNLNDLNREFEVRLQNKIPPGFAETKDENVIGDFIIWKEILTYSKNCSPSILITDDKKADWAYKPGERLRKEMDSSLSRIVEKIADPRLCKEYKDERKIDEFYVVGLKGFIASLYEIDQNKYKVLKSYISKDDAINAAASKSQNPENTCERMKKYMYKAEAVRDSAYMTFSDSLIEDIVKHLKFYNYGRQAAGMSLLSTNINSIAQNYCGDVKRFKNDLFVLGRNVYQSACGGEWNSENFVSDISNHSALFNTERTGNPILEGAFFEIYFNRYGEFRKKRKSDYQFQVLTAIMHHPGEKEFLNEILSPFKDYLPYIPGENHLTFIASKCTLANDVLKIKNISFEGCFVFYPDRESNDEDDYGYVSSDVGRLKVFIQDLTEIPSEVINICKEDGTNLENSIRVSYKNEFYCDPDFREKIIRTIRKSESGAGI